MPKPLLIDTDPGTDDAIALLMALRSPALEVVGITTVGGNARIGQTTRNALRILEYTGRSDVPLAQGAAKPLHGSFTYAYDFHGPGGLTVRLPLPKLRPRDEDAPSLLYRRLKERPGAITLVALGPLTNLACLFQRHSDAPGLVRELVVMGGAVRVPGNITPYAEFNLYNDPLAAQRVFDSGAPLTLVGLDVCRPASVGPADIEYLGSGKGRESRLARRILQGWFRRHTGGQRYDLCDPLAMAAVIQPSLLGTQAGRLSVEVADATRRGQTRYEPGTGGAQVALEVDVQGFFQLLKDALQ